MLKKMTACILSVAAMTGPALAQSWTSGAYWGIHVGGSFPPDQDIDGTFGDSTAPEFDTFTGDIDFKPGFFGSVVLGIQRGQLGLELEGFYQAVNPDRVGIDFDLQTDDFFVGDGSLFGGMVNLIYSPAIGQSRWRPRLGGGVGYGRITFDITDAFDDSDGGLVYQGLLGLGYMATERMEIQLNGRYFGITNVDFDDSNFESNASFNAIVATIGLVWRM